MAIVNNVKDSRWLQLEVCREYQRNKCSRPDTECKFAHPPAHVEVQNGRVIACYDSIKGRCNREKPPCKYFHPPQHLKDQLLINGRNHLALKNAIMQQLPLQPLLQPPTAQLTPAVVSIMNASTSPYMPAIAGHTASSFSPYLSPSPMIPAGMVPADALAAPPPPPQLTSIVHTPIVTQKAPRTDRLEVCREYQRGNCKRPETECRFAHPPDHVTVDSAEGMVTVCMDFVKGRCSRDMCRYFHPTPHLQAQLKAAQSRANAASTQAAMPNADAKKRLHDSSTQILQQRPSNATDNMLLAFPGVSPYSKRPAMDKSGLPVYQPSTAAYQQALAMQVQQPFVPVSYTCLPSAVTGHPTAVPRF
ncbi:muscleblind-like protein 2a isoform X3 [Parasteatoda tepidariorum]|uniref:muscleblind-like protein 2a isoform X3 n=1 Tax=Parasteatoda tepidariorum TaxID=114398 RepID=UPI001C71ADF5|nr:muscleblind-like protein 2a isoform X3 [Parasteatoda tepidariorum]